MLTAAVGTYARRLHAVAGDTHHVVSALGAWLLLALVAPVAGGALDDVIGMPADEADRLARALLDDPHPSLRLRVAAWRRTHGEALDRWLTDLGGVATVGDVPDRSGADAWANDATGGLIERFPLTIDAATLLVLASAVACSVDWEIPFEVVDAGVAATLPRTPGFDAVRGLLHDAEATGEQFLARSGSDLLAVHAARSRGDDLLVVSVCGPPDATSDDVLRQAHVTAVALAHDEPVATADLFDLPLGDGHAWTLTEELTTRAGRETRFASVLPAWSATTDLDLLADGLGFDVAARTLAELVGDAGLPTEARQSAMARYTRTGFAAAAVTSVGVRRSMIIARDGVRRTARLQFVRPYAVVAVARAHDGPWSGLPVFSAWVTRADEP